MATPNMGLQLPSVGVTVGPAWASVLNTALEVVDAHDHTPGNGLAITPEALDIDSDLDFQGNAAKLLSRVELVSQAATSVLPGAVYVVGGDLWFTNAAGTPIQLTVGSTPAAGGGSISGMTGTTASASYDSGTKAFLWNQSPTLRAALDAGGLLLRQGSTAAAAYVALAAPTSGVASYTLRLPGALPSGAAGYLSADTSGNGSWAYLDNVTLERSGTTLRIKDLGVSTAKLAAGAVTTAKIATGNVTGGVTGTSATGSIAYQTIVTENLVAAAITTAKLADGNVTTAKIADSNVTAAKIGNGEIITAKIADLNVTTGKLADASVTTSKLADLNVTTAKLADLNVTTAKLADLNVTTGKLASLSVTSAKIADLNVTTGKIADLGVTAAKIANGTITRFQIADATITAQEIAGNTITAAEIATGAIGAAELADAVVSNAKLGLSYWATSYNGSAWIQTSGSGSVTLNALTITGVSAGLLTITIQPKSGTGINYTETDFSIFRISGNPGGYFKLFCTLKNSSGTVINYWTRTFSFIDLYQNPVFPTFPISYRTAVSAGTHTVEFSMTLVVTGGTARAEINDYQYFISQT